MPDELRMTMAIKLPEDILSEADVIAKAKPHIETFIKAITETCGGENVSADLNRVTPKTRAPAKGEELPLDPGDRGSSHAVTAEREIPGVKSGTPHGPGGDSAPHHTTAKAA